MQNSERLALAVGVALCLTLPGCDGDRVTLLDHSFEIDPGGHATHEFVVYGDSAAWLEIEVRALEGEGVDLLLFQGETLSKAFSKENIQGFLTFSGPTPGDAYRVELRNRGLRKPASANLKVVRDYGR